MQWSLTKLLAGLVIVLIMIAPTARAELICLGNISQDLIGNIDDVGQIVTGEQTSWANGSTIRLALPGKSSPQLEGISARFMTSTGKELQRHWLRLAFAGQAAPPKFFDSNDALLNYLRKTPGSVGFIEADEGTSLEGLIQIQIQQENS